MIEDIELQFLLKYPNGFEDDYIKELFEKFNDNKAIDIINNELNKENFLSLIEKDDFESLDKVTLKFVSKTWITSRFDKIGYRNFLKICDAKDVFYKMLYTSMYVNFKAFDELAMFVKTYDMSYDNSKGACWPTLSSFMYYSNKKCYPIKPMSVKKMATFLDLDIKYKPLPNVETYNIYNEYLNNLLKKSKLCDTREKLDAMLFILVVKGE